MSAVVRDKVTDTPRDTGCWSGSWRGGPPLADRIRRTNFRVCSVTPIHSFHHRVFFRAPVLLTLVNARAPWCSDDDGHQSPTVKRPPTSNQETKKQENTSACLLGPLPLSRRVNMTPPRTSSLALWTTNADRLAADRDCRRRSSLANNSTTGHGCFGHSSWAAVLGISGLPP